MEERHGIWVGKFEASGRKEEVRIVPNTAFLGSISVGDIFTACLGVKNTYSLKGDSHMMKNIEWGAVAYLAESKYGRNGTEVARNISNSLTGAGNYVSNVLQSTTGNINGIYDMSGTSCECTAGESGYNFANIELKYYDIYTNDYYESKKIKGDAVYETSTSTPGSSSWHQEFSWYLTSQTSVFKRGGGASATNTGGAGVFAFDSYTGEAHYVMGFRVVFVD